MAALLRNFSRSNQSWILARCQSSWLATKKPPPTVPARLDEQGGSKTPAKRDDEFSWMLDRKNMLEVRRYIEQERQFATTKRVAVRIREFYATKWLENPFSEGRDHREFPGEFMHEYDGWYYYFSEFFEQFERVRLDPRNPGGYIDTRYPLFHEDDLGDFLKMKDDQKLQVPHEMNFSPCGQFALLVGQHADRMSNCALVVSLAEGLRRGERLITVVADVLDAAWCGSSRLVYTVPDKQGRPSGTVRYVNLWDRTDDGRPYRTLFRACEGHVLLEESDRRHDVQVKTSRSGRYVLIHNHSPLRSSEIFIVDSQAEHLSAECAWKRSHGIECTMEHYKDSFYALTNTEEAGEFKLFSSPYSANMHRGSGEWSLFVDNSTQCYISSMFFQHEFCVLTMRDSEARPYFHIVPLEQAIADCLDNPYENRIWPDYLCTSMAVHQNPSSSISKLYFTQCGPGVPEVRSHVNLITGEQVHVTTSDLFRQKMEKWQKPTAVVRRLFAVCPQDGTQIPITVVYLQGCPFHRMLVNVYGDANEPTDMGHNSQWYKLLVDRWMVAFCHVRGSLDLGRSWFLEGSGDKKENSIRDLQTCMHYLHLAGFSRPDHTAVYGFAAGGMLVAGLAQRQPALFRAAVLHSPFVDVLETYLEAAAQQRYEPKLQDHVVDVDDESQVQAVASYCPFSNLTPQSYPDMLISTSLHNPVVSVTGVARYVAKLRSVNEPWVFDDGRQQESAIWLNVTETDEHEPARQPAGYTKFMYLDHSAAAAELVFLDKAV